MSVLINCHIPKTGGTSIASLLRQAYGSRHIDLYYPPPCLPLDVKYYPQLRRYWGIAKSLSSHQLRYFPPENFWPDAKFIVFFRDPLELVISAYQHLIRGAPHFEHASQQPDCLKSIEAFASQISQCDTQTRFLAGCPPDMEMSSRHLDLALGQLERYDYIGLTERYEESTSIIAKDYPEFSGINVHENRNPLRGTRRYRDELTSSQIAFIEQHNKFDIVLYARVLDLFEDRLR